VTDAGREVAARTTVSYTEKYVGEKRVLFSNSRVRVRMSSISPIKWFENI
jgi:hypothetical protein